MTKLTRYLKPFITGLLISVVLLFAQAICELNLPNYMSDIVNVGIQQNGIEHGAPDAISQEGYTFMRTFMTDAEKSLLEQSYTGAQGSGYTKDYPDAEGKTIYIKKSDLSLETMDELDYAFGSATWTLINLMSDMAEQSGQEQSDEMDINSVDISKMYQMQPILDNLPAAAFDGAREKAIALDSGILVQSGTRLVPIFYRELGVDMGSYQSKYIINIGIYMLLIAIASGIATILVSYISSKIAAGVARNLRRDIFAKVESFSNAEYDKFSTASLITRTTNDVTQIQMVLAFGIRLLVYAPIMGVGGIMMALNKSTSMSWIIALAVIVLLGMIGAIFTVVMPKFKLMQKLVDRLNLVARETLNGLMVIRAFGTDAFEKDRFDKANVDYAKTNRFVSRVMTFMMPLIMLIMNGVSLLIIWVGAHNVAESQMQVGDMMAFMQYAMQIIMSFIMISMMFIFLPRASVSGQRIAEVLETEASIVDPKEPKKIISSNKGFVEFKNVSFRYHGADEDALSGISFTAKPGETTAFIGSTGSGKSTLINLIMRFYDTTNGDVLVDGVNVKQVSQKDLRSHIGYVPQQSVLMSGTIKSNISYGNESLSEQELERVAEVAQALSFINDKEDKFASEIAQGGTNVSGGQKQRLSIARALAVKPDIYIFDDSFSALDFKTDAALRAALKQHTGDSTVIIVAQRVSTIMNANCIHVIDDGKIVGSGTHKELLKSCTQYYEIASSQLGEEELQ